MVAIYEPLTSFVTLERAAELAASGLFADDVPGITTAYERLSATWDETVDRARQLDVARLDEQVGGEWSFIETLRHLVFVTDLWVGEMIEEDTAPHHPWGMPPDFVPPGAVAAMGLTVDARPSLDEVCSVRELGRARVRRVLAGLTPDALARACTPRDGQFQVVGALQCVLFEEWAHHQYATRDLAVLEHAPRA